MLHSLMLCLLLFWIHVLPKKYNWDKTIKETFRLKKKKKNAKKETYLKCTGRGTVNIMCFIRFATLFQCQEQKMKHKQDVVRFCLSFGTKRKSPWSKSCLCWYFQPFVYLNCSKKWSLSHSKLPLLLVPLMKELNNTICKTMPKLISRSLPHNKWGIQLISVCVCACVCVCRGLPLNTHACSLFTLPLAWPC